MGILLIIRLCLNFQHQLTGFYWFSIRPFYRHQHHSLEKTVRAILLSIIVKKFLLLRRLVLAMELFFLAITFHNIFSQLETLFRYKMVRRGITSVGHSSLIEIPKWHQQLLQVSNPSCSIKEWRLFPRLKQTLPDTWCCRKQLPGS